MDEKNLFGLADFHLEAMKEGFKKDDRLLVSVSATELHSTVLKLDAIGANTDKYADAVLNMFGYN